MGRMEGEKEEEEDALRVIYTVRVPEPIGTSTHNNMFSVLGCTI